MAEVFCRVHGVRQQQPGHLKDLVVGEDAKILQHEQKIDDFDHAALVWIKQVDKLLGSHVLLPQLIGKSKE